MSAVMSTLSMISGGRRAHRKLASRKSGQFSDAGEDHSRSQHDLSKQQRSASLQTLEAGGVVNLDSLEAKMASIEVSLAGSRRRSAGAGVGAVCHRDTTRELDALRTALSDKDSLIQSLKKQLSASLSAARLVQATSPPPTSRAETREECSALSADERRALEDRAQAVKADLEDRNNNIQELRKRLEKTHVTDNIDTRIQQAELQYKLGREELELLTLGEQARALAQLIEQADARARAATLQPTLYSMIRECGGSSVVVSCEAREGSFGAAPRAACMAVEWTNEPGLRPGDRLVEVNGSLVVSCRSQEELQRTAGPGDAALTRLVVLRAQQHSPLLPASTFTQNEAVSLRAELGALRTAADDAEKAKEGLRSDNTRLTHRISYLEEQVAELLARHHQLQPVSSSDSCITVNKSKKNVTNINISTEPAAMASTRRPSPRSEVQVFQKGPDITALVAKLPGLDNSDNLPLMRPRSNASGASSRAAVSPRASPPPPNHRSHSSHSLEARAGAGRMRHSLSHHSIHAGAGADYTAETDAAIRMIERNQRHMEKQRLKVDRLSHSHSRSRDDYFRSDSDLDTRDNHSNAGGVAGRESKHYEIKKAADRIEESIKKTNWAERKTLSIIEQLKRSQRLRKLKKNESAEDIQVETETKNYMYSRIDGKVLENAHKSSRRSSKLHSRSAKSSEFESECSDFPNGDMYSSSPRIDYGSESCSTRLSHYRKNEEQREEGKSRPTPPRKPMRLSLHKARSAHSLVNGSESESALAAVAVSELRNGDYNESGNKRPVKRTHAGAGGCDKWVRERIRDAGRATPRPQRKLLNGLSTCDAPAPAPAADDLYPENTMPQRINRIVTKGSKWC